MHSKESNRMKKIGFVVRNLMMRMMNKGRFNRDFLRNLPVEFHPAAKFMFYPLFNAEEKELANKIESFRSIGSINDLFSPITASM